MEKEEWRQIPGWEGLYEVSDQGRVWSARRRRLLSLTVNGRGYVVVDLSRNGVSRQYKVHRLVLLAFVGQPELGSDLTRHKNDVKNDNRLVNLVWGTSEENNRDLVVSGLHVNSRKIHCPNGHPLLGANLYVSPSTGGRSCKSCGNARSRIRNVPAWSHWTIKELADRIYEGLEDTA